MSRAPSGDHIQARRPTRDDMANLPASEALWYISDTLAVIAGQLEILNGHLAARGEA